jgi:hypothetical protein
MQDIWGGWQEIARILVAGVIAYGCLRLLLRSFGKRALAKMSNIRDSVGQVPVLAPTWKLNYKSDHKSDLGAIPGWLFRPPTRRITSSKHEFASTRRLWPKSIRDGFT